MKNQNIRKLSLVVLGLFLFSGVKVFSKSHSKKEYWAIRNVNIHSLGATQRAKYHKKMTKILVRLDALEKKPKYQNGSRFSYQKFLDELTGSVIPLCHADDNADKCLFGGWVSVRSGRCNTPYSSTGKAAAASAGTSQYDSSSFCNSKNLFRCNPLVFGPGMDQAKAGDEFPNINGFKNNGSPYEAGICVDISNGFGGLSDKCQRASDHLDTLRETPWRESTFFNAQRAEEFKALQAVIADRCEANREKINADGMCDSLEKSLSLTATAARAGKLNGINLQEIMPHCKPETAAEPEPSCDRSEDESLKNLYGAMDKLKETEECQFGRVQAADLNSSMQRIFRFNECPGAIQGSLSSGMEDGAKVVIQMRGSDNQFNGQVEVELNPSDSVEAIIEKIKSSESFAGACSRAAATACNLPGQDSKAAALTAELNKLKETTYQVQRGAMGHITEQVSCNIDGLDVGIAHETDNAITSSQGANERNRTAACPVYYSGEVKEALENESFGSANAPVATTITLQKGGSVLTIPHTIRGGDSGNLSSVAADIQKSDEFMKFCRGSKSATVEDGVAAAASAEEAIKEMRESFGLGADQFLTPAQIEGLTKVRDIEGLGVSVDSQGKISFAHEDLASLKDRLEGEFGPLNIGPNTTSVDVYPTPETRVDFMAKRASLTLTEAERSAILPIVGSGSDNSVTVVSGISRDGDGNLMFVTNGETGQRALSEERLASFSRSLGGLVIEPSEGPEATGLYRSYTIRAPAAEEYGTPEVSTVPTEISSGIRDGLSVVSRRIDEGDGHFRVEASEPLVTESGEVTITYTLDREGRYAGQTATVNLFLNNIKNSIPRADRERCSISPRAGSAVNREGKFTLICQPAQ